MTKLLRLVGSHEIWASLPRWHGNYERGRNKTAGPFRETVAAYACREIEDLGCMPMSPLSPCPAEQLVRTRGEKERGPVRGERATPLLRGDKTSVSYLEA